MRVTERRVNQGDVRTGHGYDDDGENLVPKLRVPNLHCNAQDAFRAEENRNARNGDNREQEGRLPPFLRRSALLSRTASGRAWLYRYTGVAPSLHKNRG
jgi:hypothetical protein